jgi:predicted MFS family arabinose efflux permease
VNTATESPPRAPVSAWAPFHQRAFVVIWAATLVSNIGSWMYNVASGWLMISLDPSPLSVSLIQVANALPMFLFAIPAGAVADIVDQRKFLIVGEIAITVTSSIFALFVTKHWITPSNLLVFTFIVTIGSAVTAPAWQSVVSKLVPKPELPSAVAANSVGINVSRAVGPALGGLIVAGVGIAAPFWLDAFSNLGVIAALIWWRAPAKASNTLVPESFGSAVRTGLRHARYNPYLSATLIRTVAFFLFASAYWALLPLVAQKQLHGGPALYGVLLGAIGVSAIAGAFLLRSLKVRLGPDRLLAAATAATAVSMGLFAVANNAFIAIIASLLAGVSWISSVSTLNVSAQVALPQWVRGRGLAMYVTVMFGALTLGSAIWGEVAAQVGASVSLLTAASGAIIAIVLTRSWKLQTGATVDLSPSMHWPEPVTSSTVDPDRGPVLVTIEYQIDSSNRDAFLRAIGRSANERRRDGAYNWGIFEDPAAEGRIIETFMADSWLEHLRQHERVTNADRVLETATRKFQVGDGPLATHWVGVQSPR